MATLAPPIYAEKYLDVLEFNQPPSNLIAFYKSLLNKADALMIEDFHVGVEVYQLVKSRAWIVEQIIIQIWQNYIQSDTPGLVAVGGFGRGELHPYSDVDLLILVPKNNDQFNESIRSFIQTLWDIGLETGQSVRTPLECQAQAKDDVTVATNLMEARFIRGNKKLFKQMESKVTAKKIWKGEDFYIAKLNEQRQRHKKYSDTTFNVEPNIKQGQGGLRDIQMVSWVAQRFFQTNSLHELVDEGFLTEYEYIRLKKGQNFLWKVRFALHIIAKRKEERVLFDYQLKLAKIFGFHDEGRKNPAVEQFMQIFYRNAMRLERLNSRLLQLFDENILKSKQKDTIQDINKRFHSVNNFLEIKDTQLFQSDHRVWFETFLLIQDNKNIKGIRADTVRSMRHNIVQIDENFRNNTQVKQQFIQIFQQKYKVASVLNQMNRLGILARYLPVFGKIVGRMQFDLFHIYTVDQHSLFTLRNLCLLRYNKTDVKRAHEIFNNIDKPYLVYIAGLYHDIAKGREGRHADLGAIDVQKFCVSHLINSDDTALVVWLVKYHLIMSEVAQKRDLNDIETIKNFTKQVDSLLKLRALYLLTIADISATDPKLWNGFKESLLHELFTKAKQELTNQKPAAIHSNSDDKKKPQLIQQVIKSQPTPIVAQISTKQLKPNSTTKIEKQHNDVEFLIYCKDFRGLFYLMASILEKHNFNIVDANIKNTKNNYALNTVHCITDSDEKIQSRMITELRNSLAGGKFYDINLSKFTPKSEKLFKITPKVIILESNNEHESMIEVICRDRHGLLALIAKILLSLNISINAAKIVTIGARAENTYWLNINQQALNNQQLDQLKNKLLESL
ncbi:MAG: [protein-PII] uridylyltransferase [Proteobacteria bacterium]|nr:[protein-PII] uridylyltransferase [Pseudomonadota bacterium]